MPSRQKIIAAVVIVALAAAAWSFLRGHRSSGAVTLYGNVDIRQIDLAFAVDGIISQVAVDEGATVTPGQVLARLDDAPYRHAADEADAVLAKAIHGNRIEDIDAARAAVAEAQAQVNNAKATYQRRAALLREHNVSQQTVDDARRDMKVSQATLDSREASLRLMVQGSRPEDIDAAKAAAAAAHYRLDQTTIVAPAAGTIVTRIREPGAVGGPSAPVLSLALTAPVWVRTYAPEPVLSRVAPGTKVTIRSDATGDKTYEGTIGFVSPTAEFTPKTVETPELRTDLVYRLRIVVNAPDGALRQGMPVTVTIPPAS
jgi:HlyD family secretion protein